MKTIKTKLFLSFFTFMMTFVFCSILLNTLFLEKFYIYKNRAIFTKTADEIIEAYNSNVEAFKDYIKAIDRSEGMSIVISDKDNIIKYSSYPQKQEYGDVKLPGEIVEALKNNKINLNKTYFYSVIEGAESGNKNITYISNINNEDILVLKKPLKGIVESTRIANEFFIFIGGVLCLIGGLITYIFSKRISKPIIVMSDVAEGIANLNFEKRVQVTTEDEIGTLGESINMISENLQEELERRKQLVRNMSHELKTPIAAVKGYTEGLKYGIAEDKEKAEKYYKVIISECDRMDSMIRELLNLSMLEGGAIKLNISKFQFYEFIKTLSEKFHSTIEEKNLTFKINIEKSIFVKADYKQLESAVNNFLINALRHAAVNGCIKVEAQVFPSSIRISVFNEGQHIAEEELKHIWDVFYTVDKARTRKYDSHGLGLSIVQSIAKLHGGTCGAENIKDGVQFFIEIPQQ